MRQVLWDLFGCDGLSPEFNNCANRCSSADDDWFTTKNLIVGNDIAMFGCGGHRRRIFLGQLIGCYWISPPLTIAEQQLPETGERLFFFLVQIDSGQLFF